jgi:lysophospholipase L1-like esterase
MRLATIAAFAMAVSGCNASGQTPVIAQWGSSVSNGVGDTSGAGGYAGRLDEMLSARGWSLFNQSRGGDNTILISARFDPGDDRDLDTKYLTDVDPDYVVIGLSLGNEGIARCAFGQTNRCVTSVAAADAVYEQFANGLMMLIERSRRNGITPVVALAYARSDFSAFEYEYTRRMNLLINSWDVPSVNLLGAIDDGHGRWARGFYHDPLHPNAAGHEEMFHAFVPTLFDALEAGKAAPQRHPGTGFARVDARMAPARLRVSIDDTMRSFGLSFQFRAASDGTIAAVSGQSLSFRNELRRASFGDQGWDYESFTLTPNSDDVSVRLVVNDGRLFYFGTDGNALSGALGSDDGWHDVTLTHYVARGETLLYIDSQRVGAVAERLQPNEFLLGGATADYRHWMIHRAGLNAYEVAAIHAGEMLQSSLEVYAPLTAELATPAMNLAQSFTEVETSEVQFLARD